MASIQDQFSDTEGFRKELKKLSRRYNALSDDIDNMKSVLPVVHFSSEITP